ncbi:hypothetical protein GCM10010358_31720 [Streptomyces minutiscleroticus]|uniref:Uncharacterized protein n=1 Tax=Streptomyces minutiscleroticus TaxID=68238 RepID=A0A918KUU6_9ACTN|nr:hypothetical protein GCM10010358_31720 [Streptomyces minutiscleroticus]
MRTAPSRQRPGEGAADGREQARRRAPPSHDRALSSLAFEVPKETFMQVRSVSRVSMIEVYDRAHRRRRDPKEPSR